MVHDMSMKCPYCPRKLTTLFRRLKEHDRHWECSHCGYEEVDLDFAYPAPQFPEVYGSESLRKCEIQRHIDKLWGEGRERGFK